MRAATGEQPRKNGDGTYSKRVRLGEQKVMLHMPELRDLAKAKERGDMLAVLAHELTLANTPHDAARAALKRIAAQQSISMKAARQTLSELGVAGWKNTSVCPTFEEICRRWNDNSLAREYPDDSNVKLRKESSTIQAAKGNLNRHILPLIGKKPVDMITLADCDEIKKALPATLQGDSRRQALTPLRVVLDICVQPLQLLERSPLPEGWLPKKKPPRELQWLRPAEDALLMKCTAVPLCWRVLWGFYIRNGARENEALAMTLSQFDLGDKPMAELFAHQVKTKEGRLWSLETTLTAEGLRRWVALQRADAKPHDPMFVNEAGKRIVSKTVKLPELLRAHLKLAGVTRPALFTTTRTSRNICVHDLRATFITTKMALVEPKWTEADLQQVSGHETSTELNRYRRKAKALADIQAGDFLPLHEAIPELRAASPAPHGLRLVAGQRTANENAKSARSLETTSSIVELLPPEKPLGIGQTDSPGQTLPGISDPAGHSLAAMQAQIDALQQLVIGGLADRVAAAVAERLQPPAAKVRRAR